MVVEHILLVLFARAELVSRFFVNSIYYNVAAWKRILGNFFLLVHLCRRNKTAERWLEKSSDNKLKKKGLCKIDENFSGVNTYR